MSSYLIYYYCLYFFFFQAEDGIRDLTVTGVQTCALPISRSRLTPFQRSRKYSRRVDRTTPWRQSEMSPARASLGRTWLPWKMCGSNRSSRDRKSTRLNSSHSQISYAVFCLKKKKNLSYLPSTVLFFFFNDTATTEIYTLSLHDALPISRSRLTPFQRSRKYSRRVDRTTPWRQSEMSPARASLGRTWLPWKMCGSNRSS